MSAELRAATALLTRLPVRLPEGRTGSAAFPVVGAALGALAAVPAALLAGIAPLLGAMLALGVIEIATGFLHLDGLADTADALAAPDAARAETARKDPRIGTAGAGAIVIVLGAAAGAIVAIPGWAVLGAMVVAGAASRAVPAIAAPLLGRAETPETGFGAWFAQRSGPGGAAVALLGSGVAAILAVAVTLALAPGRGPGTTAVVAPVLAPVLGLAAGLSAGLLLVAGLRARFGRLFGDHYGASIEVAFMAALAAQAIAWGTAR